MRITAGSFRGRKLAAPDIQGLRPTPAKVRQALFNMLGDIHGQCVLELFSGSGVMALEALSRGAASVISIEQHPKAIRAMQRIQQDWPVEHWQLLPFSVEKGLAQLSARHFDLIFADPPYATGLSESVPLWLGQHHITCEQLVIEESSKHTPHWSGGWQLFQSRSYGDTCLHFLHRTEDMNGNHDA